MVTTIVRSLGCGPHPPPCIAQPLRVKVHNTDTGSIIVVIDLVGFCPFHCPETISGMPSLTMAWGPSSPRQGTKKAKVKKEERAYPLLAIRKEK